MIHQNKNMQQSVLNLFGIDLENMPYNSFNEGMTEIDIRGNVIETWFRKFQDKNFITFDTIELQDFNGQFQKVILKSFKLHRINFWAVRKMINSLFKILGPDLSNKGPL